MFFSSIFSPSSFTVGVAIFTFFFHAALSTPFRSRIFGVRRPTAAALSSPCPTRTPVAVRSASVFNPFRLPF